MVYATVLKKIKKFITREDGASGIEYAIIAGLAATVMGAFMTPVSTIVKTTFNSILTSLGGTAIP